MDIKAASALGIIKACNLEGQVSPASLRELRAMTTRQKINYATAKFRQARAENPNSCARPLVLVLKHGI